VAEGSVLGLRCYALRKRDETWYAHCIDLTLDAEGETYSQARQNLDRVIISYLRTVFDKGLQDELVPRPSPLSFKIEYFKIWLTTRLPSWIGGILGAGRTERIELPGAVTPVHA